jgi:hypothetical protein
MCVGTSNAQSSYPANIPPTIPRPPAPPPTPISGSRSRNQTQAAPTTKPEQVIRADIDEAATRWEQGKSTAAENQHYGNAPRTKQGFIDRWTNMAERGKFPGEQATTPWVDAPTTNESSASDRGDATPKKPTSTPQNGTGNNANNASIASRARRNEKRAAALKQGRRSTILTGTRGDLTPVKGTHKTLLGS